MKNFSRLNHILCFSSHSWDFELKRAQHLLLRFAENASIYYFEDPVFDAVAEPSLSFATRSETLWKVVPHLKKNLSALQIQLSLEGLLDTFFENASMENWIFWYYDCTAISFTRKYNPGITVYDCIEAGGPVLELTEDLSMMDKELQGRSDLVFKADGSLHAAEENWDHSYHHIAQQIKNVASSFN